MKVYNFTTLPEFQNKKNSLLELSNFSDYEV